VSTLLSVRLVALDLPHREAFSTPTRYRFPCLFRKLLPLPVQWNQNPPPPGCPPRGSKTASTIFSRPNPSYTCHYLVRVQYFAVSVSALRASLQVSAYKRSILVPRRASTRCDCVSDVYAQGVSRFTLCWCPPILEFPLLPCARCLPRA